MTYCLPRIRVHSTKMQVLHAGNKQARPFCFLRDFPPLNECFCHHHQHSWKAWQFIRERYAPLLMRHFSPLFSDNCVIWKGNKKGGKCNFAKSRSSAVDAISKRAINVDAAGEKKEVERCEN